MIEHADIRGMLDALKETRMISGTGAFGDGGHVQGRADSREGASTEKIAAAAAVAPSSITIVVPKGILDIS
jgi:hypothetical protein